MILGQVWREGVPMFISDMVITIFEPYDKTNTLSLRVIIRHGSYKAVQIQTMNICWFGRDSIKHFEMNIHNLRISGEIIPTPYTHMLGTRKQLCCISN